MTKISDKFLRCVQRLRREDPTLPELEEGFHQQLLPGKVVGEIPYPDPRGVCHIAQGNTIVAPLHEQLPGTKQYGFPSAHRRPLLSA